MNLLFKSHAGRQAKGFTLVELVVVILILSAVGLATTNYIALGLDMYRNITAQDRAVNSIRFVMERLHREVPNAVPNSLEDGNNCLRFNPIKMTTIYEEFPRFPAEASEMSVLQILEYQHEPGDKVSVNLSDPADLTGVNADGSAVVQVITSVTADNTILNFAGLSSFPIDSPANRAFIFNDRYRITYCFNNNQLTRREGSGPAVLMAENITGSFTAVNPTLQSNGMVRVEFQLDLEDRRVDFEQALHVTNVP